MDFLRRTGEIFPLVVRNAAFEFEALRNLLAVLKIKTEVIKHIFRGAEGITQGFPPLVIKFVKRRQGFPVSRQEAYLLFFLRLS